MKNNQQLINNIIGQLQGINNMLTKNKECFDVLTQLKSVKSAVDSLTIKVIEENFFDCLKKCSTSEKQEEICKKFLQKIIKL
ncbi:MAG: hypothetical protein UR27_C0001G0033 [Candidatus Peregrinibacteria bacterium GW2011_GWA2_33_10]|nr:MAG: hypothetical protein UR27_C0001G0033 [Candidatus Peregrinibacteria bacterium GW2011_GWA2_33_10]KKP39763.1 MAG: hypothetical protein UR30_C0008G0032 [Candidatus Peregrinibacteria bacterium GW2011_GWC2_33_13]